MRYSILFVLALVVVSGFIAYFGDILGRRMGKKRLTLFNLRPRYTAIVVTTITGMIISGLAVLALVSVNSEFRKVLTEGERIFAQNKRLAAKSVALTRSNRALLERRQELLKLVAERQKELEAARDHLREAERARDAAARTVYRLEADIAARKKAIELLSARKFAVDTELDKRTEDLKAVQASLSQAQSNLAKVQSRLQVISDKYSDAVQDLDKANLSLSDAEKKLSYTQSRLLDVQSTLMKRTQELLATEKALNTEKTARFKAEALRSEFEQQFRSGNLVLRQGDEIARGVVSPDQPAFGVGADLLDLLETAGERAQKRGARPGSNGRAVSLVLRSPKGAVLEDETELDRRNVARDAIMLSKGPVLVQVICARNTVAGEQALVEFVVYPNSLVFRRGELIATTQMDGRSSEARALLSLIAFLQGPVAEEAVAKGVIPVANFDPRQSMGVNPQKQLDALLDLVDQVRATRSKVTVTVYASADIYAVGPLNMDNLRFTVTKTE